MAAWTLIFFFFEMKVLRPATLRLTKEIDKTFEGKMNFFLNKNFVAKMLQSCVGDLLRLFRGMNGDFPFPQNFLRIRKNVSQKNDVFFRFNNKSFENSSQNNKVP